MEYFPHLQLGHLQGVVSFYSFCFCLILIFCIIFFIKKKYKLLKVLVVSLLLSVPSCIVMDVTINNKIFSKIHLKQNKHMPKYSECIKYNAFFSYLDAEFKVSPGNLKRWVDKYKLKEEPPNTYKSKRAPNGQGIIAIYNPTKEILVIKYHAF
jgi:hypothetical protein